MVSEQEIREITEQADALFRARAGDIGGGTAPGSKGVAFRVGGRDVDIDTYQNRLLRDLAWQVAFLKKLICKVGAIDESKLDETMGAALGLSAPPEPIEDTPEMSGD